MTLTDRIRRTALGLLAAALAATLGVTLAPPTQPAHAGLYYNYSIENRTMLPLSLVSAKMSDGTVLLGAPKTIPAVHQATFSALKGGMNNRPIVQVTYSFTDEDGSTRKLVLNGTRNGGEDDSTCYTDSAIFRCDIALATSPFNDSGTIFILERKLFTTIPVDDTTQPLLWRQLVDLCFVIPADIGAGPLRAGVERRISRDHEQHLLRGQRPELAEAAPATGGEAVLGARARQHCSRGRLSHHSDRPAEGPELRR